MVKNAKEKLYERIYTQLKKLFQAREFDSTAKMATINALLKYKLGFYWCGFYRFQDGDLIVGPYQGKIACLILKKDTGVCWAAFNSGAPVIVPDVSRFEGHIACDPKSQSELVIPFRLNGKIAGVFDVDSDQLDFFDNADAKGLENIISLL